jgi:hypothetical protein
VEENLIYRSSTANENMNTVANAAALKLPHINKKGGAGFLAGTVVTNRRI